MKSSLFKFLNNEAFENSQVDAESPIKSPGFSDNNKASTHQYPHSGDRFIQQNRKELERSKAVSPEANTQDDGQADSQSMRSQTRPLERPDELTRNIDTSPRERPQTAGWFDSQLPRTPKKRKSKSLHAKQPKRPTLHMPDSPFNSQTQEPLSQ